MDGGSAQTSAEEQAPPDIQGTQDDESSDVGSARTGTDLIEGSVHSGAEKEIEQKELSFEARDGVNKDKIEV